MLRRLLVCLAFATCCFLNTWVEFAEGQSSYFARYDPFRTVAVPVICWEVLLSGAMLGIWEFYRRRTLERERLIHVAFLLGCGVPLGIAAVAMLRLSPIDLIPVIRKPIFWPIVLTLAAGPLGFAIVRPQSASRFMRSTFLYTSPVLGFVLIQAARTTLLRHPEAAYIDGPAAPALQASAGHVRVVWIIFDELSQTITFANRPVHLTLPNFDRLRAESFYATSARAPGESTEISMPALVVGERVARVDLEGPANLGVWPASRSEASSWSSMPNVFDDARKLGFNTAIVGWHHPYGRLLNRSLTKWYWTAGWLTSGVEEPTRPEPLVKLMWDRAELQFAALPLIGHFPGVFPGIYARREKLERLTSMVDVAARTVADPSIGLVLVHLPVPHPPAVYNRSTRELTGKGSIGYVDSVALADQILGALARSIRAAGLWDRTAILVSGDHGWRTQIWRGDPEWTAEEEATSHRDTSGVPFLLKLPNQLSAFSYDKPFNTVITREMISSILEGRLTDPARVSDSIERLQSQANPPN